MKIDKLTNNEILRKINDITDEHERTKSEIVQLCRKLDNVEKEYKKYMGFLSERMGKK